MMDQRHLMKFSAVNQVEIRVGFLDAQETAIEGSAWFQCIPCCRELVINPQRRLFECPECGYELTPGEVSELCDRHVAAIERTFGCLRPAKAEAQKARKRGVLWRFIHWLSGRRRTPKTLPTSSETP